MDFIQTLGTGCDSEPLILIACTLYKSENEEYNTVLVGTFSKLMQSTARA